MNKRVWLSYIIDKDTPLYGGRVENLNIYKTSSIKNNQIANDTKIETTVHIGTHIDMPYHFYENGQTIDDFSIDFWFFDNPLIIHIKPQGYIIEEELINELDNKDKNSDILIVKTGLCTKRATKDYWEKNYGFSPKIYEYLTYNFPNIRVIGFDSISISSWQNRDLGKVSHKAFLNPKRPIIILEDMDLNNITKDTKLNNIILSPLRIKECDGLPCSVYGIYK